MQVRMIERAVLKQPCVAPAYFNITAHNNPPKAFIAMTKNTRLLYPVVSDQRKCEEMLCQLSLACGKSCKHVKHRLSSIQQLQPKSTRKNITPQQSRWTWWYVVSLTPPLGCTNKCPAWKPFAEMSWPSCKTCKLSRVSASYRVRDCSFKHVQTGFSYVSSNKNMTQTASFGLDRGLLPKVVIWLKKETRAVVLIFGVFVLAHAPHLVCVVISVVHADTCCKLLPVVPFVAARWLLWSVAICMYLVLWLLWLLSFTSSLLLILFACWFDSLLLLQMLAMVVPKKKWTSHTAL